MPKAIRTAKVEVILQLMDENDIENQKELANRAGVSEDTLTDLLAHKRNSGVGTYKKIAGVFNVEHQVLYETRSGVPLNRENAAIFAPSAEPSVPASLHASSTISLLDFLTTQQFSRHRVEEHLAVVSKLVKSVFGEGLAWIDVMRWVDDGEVADGDPLVQLGEASGGWLKVEFSEITRSDRPRLIPVEVGGKPWRGSGAAFKSRGIDYVDRMTERVIPEEYGLESERAAEIRAQYEAWEVGHYFTSLVALAVPPRSAAGEVTGVLNLNYSSPEPFGAGKTLPPDLIKPLLSLLEPHMLVVAQAIQASVN